jgi:hypothetical protein
MITTALSEAHRCTSERPTGMDRFTGAGSRVRGVRFLPSGTVLILHLENSERVEYTHRAQVVDWPLYRLNHIVLKTDDYNLRKIA